MYCGIPKCNVDVIDNLETKAVFANHLIEVLKDSNYNVYTDAVSMLQKMSLFDMLSLTTEDVKYMLWNKYFNAIIQPLKEKYPNFKKIMDSNPQLEDDDYWNEYTSVTDLFEQINIYDMYAIYASKTSTELWQKKIKETLGKDVFNDTKYKWKEEEVQNGNYCLLRVSNAIYDNFYDCCKQMEYEAKERAMQYIINNLGEMNIKISKPSPNYVMVDANNDYCTRFSIIEIN